MRTWICAAVLLMAALAGCAAPAASPQPQLAPSAPAWSFLALGECDPCFEPSIAALPSGRLAVLDVASYDAGDNDCSLFAKAGVDGNKTVLATGLQPMFGRACPTDFASMVRTMDGGLATVWGDAEAQRYQIAMLR